MHALQKRRSRLYTISFLACGIWLIALGLYFIFLRPALLPEDLRYMGASARDMQDIVPGLQRWTHHVFTVMGGFIAASGLLAITVALHSGGGTTNSAQIVLALAGVLTVGLMSVTNFQINSDFKWLLLVPALIWAFGLLANLRLRSGNGVPAGKYVGENANQ